MIEYVKMLIEMILHVDQYLSQWTQQYGDGVMVLVFIIVFCETGLVITPFLPGDSLLFALGAITALPEGGLSYSVISLTLICAAILGDSFNYFVGRKYGTILVEKLQPRFISPKYIKMTEEFFENRGRGAVFFARFAPILRTYVPFVAGTSKMSQKMFFTSNIVGAVVWVQLFLALGYFFGNQPAVRKNFSVLIFAIIIISLIPVLVAALKGKKQSQA